jgi:uncharacterized damage-inducible protein DinB
MLGELLVSKWRQVRLDLLATIDKFADADLTFRPADGAYCAGELMLHVAHEEAIEMLWGLARRFDEMPPAYELSRYPTAGAIKGVLAEVHAQTLGYVEAIDDAALTSEVTLAWGQEGRPVDMVWHAIEHEIHHRGELSLMLGLLGRQGLDA